VLLDDPRHGPHAIAWRASAPLHLEGWYRHDAAVARWSAAFLKSWLSESAQGAIQKSLCDDRSLMLA
jgi:hypothetical protein